MKIKVIKRFNDRITLERKEIEKIYNYSEERAQELIKNGFAEPYKENAVTVETCTEEE